MKNSRRNFISVIILHVALCSVLVVGNASALIDYPGRIDDTFGNYVQSFAGTRLGGASASLQSLAVQPDGKILVAGSCNTTIAPAVFQMCVGRLSASGVPDASYGVGGAFRLNESGVNYSAGTYLAPLPDGSTYAVATCGESSTSSHPCIVRLTPNGAKDVSYGTNGFLAYTPLVTQVTAVLVRKSGKLVVLGQCSQAICIAQFSASGTYEVGFRTTWGSATGVTGFLANSIAEEASNRLVIAGTCFVPSGIRGCAVRYYALDGIPSGGDPLAQPYIWNTSERSNGYGLAIQPDGAWLLSGNCEVSGVNRFCVQRVEPTGALDGAFGNAGVAILPFTGLDNQARAMALQPDGKITLAGICRAPSEANYIYCAVRLQQDGRFDTSFGFNRDGRELIPLDRFAVSVSAALLQRDGQLLIGGGGGEMKVFRLRGGWFGAKQCDFDVDGDNVPGTSNDIMLATRASMGFTDTSALAGVNFSVHASRQTWRDIRSYLVAQCAMSIVE